MNSKNIIVGLLLLTVVGCSNAPKEVEASIALVPDNKSTLAGEKTPFSIEKHLHQSVSQSIIYKDYTIQISPIYISALGFNCTTLTFRNTLNDNISKTACQQKNSDTWLLIKPINTSVKQVIL